MLDKFMQLIHRILKVLDMPYYENIETNEYGNIEYELDFKGSDPKSMIGIVSTPEGYPIIIKEVGIYDKYDSDRIRLRTNIYPSTNCMSIIYSIFNKRSTITDWSNPQIKRYIISEKNHAVVDDVLGYSDEEFKLYISML